MSYCLIGESLPHTKSKEIHNLLGQPDYYIEELPPEKLEEFVKAKKYNGFNITIPYKEKIIPYLYKVEGDARGIGAVNTAVLTPDGYVGYNTDIGGMECALNETNISLKNKNVLILGTGGTSKTAQFVAKKGGAKTVFIVGRKSEINYENVYDLQETEIIINTTPVGMYPKCDAKPIDITKFDKLCGVFDVIYNPTTTLLVKEATAQNIPAANGLTMLIEQARLAEEIFVNKQLPKSLTQKVMSELLRI